MSLFTCTDIDESHFKRHSPLCSSSDVLSTPKNEQGENEEKKTRAETCKNHARHRMMAHIAIVDGVRDPMHVPHNISHKTLTQLFISLV